MVKHSLLFAAFLLLSLLNHGLVPWFLGTALLAFYCVLNIEKIHNKDLLVFLLFFITFLALSFKFLTFDSEFVPIEYVGSFTSNFVMYFMYILIFCLALGMVRSEGLSQRLLRVLQWLLALHVSVFIFQFVVLITTGNFIDFVQPITGEESRYSSFDQTLNQLGFYRCTGLFVEPSTYSSLITLILVLRAIAGPPTKLDFLACFTMLISFSSAGIVIAALFFIYYFRKKALVASVVTSLSLVIFLFTVDANITSQITGAQLSKLSGSSGSRLDLVDYAVKREGVPFFFGYGPYAVEEELMIKSSPDYGRYRLASMNDAGFLVFLSLRFGLLGVIVFLLLCALSLIRAIGLFRFAILSLTKLAIFHPFFLIALAIGFGLRATDTRLQPR